MPLIRHPVPPETVDKRPQGGIDLRSKILSKSGSILRHRQIFEVIHDHKPRQPPRFNPGAGEAILWDRKRRFAWPCSTRTIRPTRRPRSEERRAAKERRG